MSPESPRVVELRRRLHADPASIAFALLAEELRRGGNHEEAVEVCRAGLLRRPGYLSAQVTLGRALIERGDLDDALVELTTVVSSAPDNLAALRGLAEIHQRGNDLPQALAFYTRALDMARHDAELEETVARITRELAAPPPVAQGVVPSVESLFDFDTLVQQLGTAVPSILQPVQPLRASEAVVESVPAWPTAPLVPVPDDDRFAEIERELRTLQVKRDADRRAERSEAESHRTAEVVVQLEAWLSAIRINRQ